MNTRPITLEQINTLPKAQAAELLHGLYEHSDWIAEQALDARPFVSIAALKQAMVQVLRQAGSQAQIALVRAHPELAGKAMVNQDLTQSSSHEQRTAGLTHCSPQEFARLQQLNAQYKAKFGFPFILAVRGPRGSGLNRQQILSTYERRLNNHPDFELAECLRNIHRIVEIRLNDKFAYQPELGHELWDWHEWLARYSESPTGLTVTYLSPAHLGCARTIALGMQACGFDEVGLDAVGNVVGIYRSNQADAPTLLTGSHYDTVKNGGKYDGRLGVFVPMVCVRELVRQGRRLPFHLEVVAFSEEEGQRYPATFIGSSALVGDFKAQWLDQQDANGITMREAMKRANLDPLGIDAITRKASDYLAFLEVHIEQGPVLNESDLPLGVVTSINGSVRYLGEVIGRASHAGTTPMDRRHDAATAVAELALYVEQQASLRGSTCVGTIGQLEVPNGSINVVPGRCRFSLDVRALNDSERDALAADVSNQLEAICKRRGLQYSLTETMRVSAAPCNAEWSKRWAGAVQALGLPLMQLPSGAGHDAMKLHEIMPQAMLFVRGENSGISHNPLESTTSDDMQLAIDAMMHVLLHTP